MQVSKPALPFLNKGVILSLEEERDFLNEIAYEINHINILISRTPEPIMEEYYVCGN